MARKRMIDPNIWESQSFNRLSMMARMLFIGLFSNADDEGRGVAHPARLRSTVFPYDDIPLDEIAAAMNECAAQVGVRFYDVNGDQFYQLENWLKWQRIDKPAPSNYPQYNPLENDSENIPGAVGEESESALGTVDEYSKNDSENTLGTVPPNRIEEKGIEEKKEEKPAQARAKDKPSPPRESDQIKALFAEHAGSNAELADALAGFYDMRKKDRKPFTFRAAQLLIGELNKLGDKGTHAALLDQSTQRGWSGVFALKEDYARQGAPPSRTASSRPTPDYTYGNNFIAELGDDFLAGLGGAP